MPNRRPRPVEAPASLPVVITPPAPVAPPPPAGRSCPRRSPRRRRCRSSRSASGPTRGTSRAAGRRADLRPRDDDDASSIEAEPVPPPRSVADLDSIEAEPVHLADSFAFEPDDDEDWWTRRPAPARAGRGPAEAEDRGAFEPPVLPDDEAGGPDPPELGDPLPPELEAADDAEDDAASDFTLTRNSTETVEELDLAAMVDVAFQLVLFFLVTASTIVFKTLEVPKPNEDKPPDAAAQSRAKSIDELEKDYILVEVDAEGAVKVDHIPVNADRAALVEKLRQARETTGRKAMLLSADFDTRHKNAVLAFDVASEIDLQIAIAQPTGKN